VQRANEIIQATRATKPHVSWSEFKTLLTGVGLLAEIDFIAVAEFLHDIGQIVWFNQVRIPFIPPL